MGNQLNCSSGCHNASNAYVTGGFLHVNVGGCGYGYQPNSAVTRGIDIKSLPGCANTASKSLQVNRHGRDISGTITRGIKNRLVGIELYPTSQ